MKKSLTNLPSKDSYVGTWARLGVVLKRLGRELRKHLLRFWFLSLPLLHVDIRIPFIEIQTSLMMYRHESYTLHYVSWRIKLFRWHFHIDLYDTAMRRAEREGRKAERGA